MSGRTPKMTEDERKEKNKLYMREYRKRNPLSKESREKQSEYLRQFRKSYPEKAKQYTENYIIKKAARILAEREAERGT